ncbi:MAG TPA: sigma-70 family RNA polymerase sigma factor [Prolixibacteraceae bacterium]
MKNIIKDRTHWLEVWTRFRSGDQAAFSEIYEAFIDSLFAYGSKITRDRELVKDCVQDIFVELQRVQPNLHHPEYIEFYLYKSLKNAIFRKAKENRRTDNLPIEEIAGFNLQFNIEQDTLDLESEKLRLEKLKSILQTLDPQKRELLFLKFSTGLNYVEIGHLLGLNPDTVKKQVYRTLDNLRGKYGNQLMELLMIWGV